MTGAEVRVVLSRANVWWHNVLEGFWFVPGTVVLGYVALGLLLVEVDRAGDENGLGLGFGGDAEAARGILSTIAGSLITVAGVAFSLTIVVLVLVSSQFSPRTLPQFLGDRLNQVTAGTFVGVFAYCLVVLRTVRSANGGSGAFVPSLSVTVSIVLALAALALLLVFIHHMGVSIQASHLAARVGRDSLAAVERLYPERYGEPEDDSRRDELLRSWHNGGEPGGVSPGRTGYVAAVQLDRIAELFDGSEVRLHVAVCPGDFVTSASLLVSVWPADALDDERRAAVRQCVGLANERDLRQDALYGVRQLADIAVKALSPGINDPTTATTCIGYLGAVLEQLAARDVPAQVRHIRGTTVIAVGRTFSDYVEVAFAEIGRYATDNARIVVASTAALARAAEAARAASAVDRLRVLADTATALAQPALEDARTERDRRLIAAGVARVEAVAR